ncbi:MAG: hypothetical protein P8103_14625 [Candidatus Thiodiazotropha sp.]
MRTSKRLLLLILAATLTLMAACDMEESRPSYSPIQNTLPAGGKLIEWDAENERLNIEQVKAELDEENGAIFSKSMDWYATESSIGFERLHGKTARQAVDLINCLKTATPEKQTSCLE